MQKKLLEQVEQYLELGFSLEGLAKYLDITPHHLIQVINHESNFSAVTLQKAFYFFNRYPELFDL